MLIRFFKSNNAIALLFLPLIACLIWGVVFFTPGSLAIKNTMVLFDFSAGKLLPIPWLASLVGLLLLIGEAYLFNFIINQNEVLSKKNYLPALFYVVFMSSHKSILTLHPLLLGNLFILFALQRLLSSYRKDKAFSNTFDTGLLISIASLFYFPFIVFLPLLGVGLLALRPFNWREWVISGIGILTPYFFLFTYYFWYDALGYLFHDKISHSFIREPENFVNSKSFYFLLGLGWFLILVALGKIMIGSENGSQKSKISIFLFICVFVLCIGFIVLTNQLSTTFFSAFAIPASVFCANYFSNIKKTWWAEFLFLLFLIALFINLWA